MYRWINIDVWFRSRHLHADVNYGGSNGNQRSQPQQRLQPLPDGTGPLPLENWSCVETKQLRGTVEAVTPMVVEVQLPFETTRPREHVAPGKVTHDDNFHKSPPPLATSYPEIRCQRAADGVEEQIQDRWCFRCTDAARALPLLSRKLSAHKSFERAARFFAVVRRQTRGICHRFEVRVAAGYVMRDTASGLTPASETVIAALHAASQQHADHAHPGHRSLEGRLQSSHGVRKWTVCCSLTTQAVIAPPQTAAPRQLRGSRKAASWIRLLKKPGLLGKRSKCHSSR